MSLHMKRTETRSELQNKLADELQERLKNKPQPFDQPDGVDDSRYIENTKQTTSLAWVWALIALAFVGIVVWLIVITL